MPFNATTYCAIDTPVHRLDARVKIVLVVVYSLALFFVNTWQGMAILAFMCLVAVRLAKLDVLRVVRQLLPIAVILFATIAANSFTLDVATPALALGQQSPLWFNQFAPVPLLGSFGFTPVGFGRGCFHALRIALLVAASLVFTTSTSSTQIMQALESFLSPFGRNSALVRDIVTVVSVALRFIPITIDEFECVKSAQKARCASFEAKGLSRKLRAWTTVFVPLIVALYRRADRLAEALDSRCYGAGKATRLNEAGMQAHSVMVLMICTAVCMVVAYVF